MPDAILQTVMEKIESKINAQRGSGLKLSFMENLTDNKVDIITDPESYQNTFRNYSILIYPVEGELYEEIPKIGNRVERIYGVGISCRRKVSKSKRRFIFFSNSNDIRTPVGPVEMSNRVKDILRNNTLDATIQPHSGRQFENDELLDDDPSMNTHEFVFRVSVLSTLTSSGVD